LHDRILKDTASFKSLFKKVNFEKPYLESKDILERFYVKRDEIYQLREKIYFNLDNDKKLFIDQLIRYVEKLTNTVELLFKRQTLHYEKSKGQAMGWGEFQGIQKAYENSIQEYTEAGDRLNQLSHILF
jgi:hypothetical protein